MYTIQQPFLLRVSGKFFFDRDGCLACRIFLGSPPPSQHPLTRRAKKKDVLLTIKVWRKQAVSQSLTSPRKKERERERDKLLGLVRFLP